MTGQTKDCSALKGNKVLIHATTRKNLENTMLSEKTVTEIIDSIHRKIQTRETYRNRIEVSGFLGLGVKDGKTGSGGIANGYGVSL